MDPIELASALFSTPSSKSERSYANVYEGTAMSNSKGGFVLVDTHGMTISEDGEQAVTLPTTVAVRKGDIVQITSVGKAGSGRYDYVSGIIGGGDRTDVSIFEANSAAMSAAAAAENALETASAASVIAGNAQTAADEALSTANEAHGVATEAKEIADGITEQVGEALEKAATAHDLATDAVEIANNSIVSNVTYYQVAGTIAPDTGDENIESWTATLPAYQEGNAQHCWVSVRTVIGDGTITWTDPVYEANWEADLQIWAAKFTDKTVYVLMPEGIRPQESSTPDPDDEGKHWSESMLVPEDGQILWSTIRRTYNNGDVEFFDISEYRGNVSSSLWYWQEILHKTVETLPVTDGTCELSALPLHVFSVTSDGQPVDYEIDGLEITVDADEVTVAYVGVIPTPSSMTPVGWAMTPPPACDGVDDGVVLSSVRTISGDGTIEWSEPSVNTFASDYVNNVYRLSSIKADYTTGADLTSAIEQSATRIQSTVREQYVAQGASGVTNLETVVVQSADSVTFGFMADSSASSSASNVTFDDSGMTFVVSGVPVASYGSVACIGETGRPHVSIASSGMTLFGDADNPSIPTAKVEGDSLWARNAEVEDYLIIGSFRFYQRANGNLTLKMVG